MKNCSRHGKYEGYNCPLCDSEKRSEKIQNLLKDQNKSNKEILKQNTKAREIHIKNLEELNAIRIEQNLNSELQLQEQRYLRDSIEQQTNKMEELAERQEASAAKIRHAIENQDEIKANKLLEDAIKLLNADLPEEAIPVLRKAIELSRTNYRLRLLLSMSLNKAGQEESVLNELNYAFKLVNVKELENDKIKEFAVISFSVGGPDALSFFVTEHFSILTNSFITNLNNMYNNYISSNDFIKPKIYEVVLLLAVEVKKTIERGFNMIFDALREVYEGVDDQCLNEEAIAYRDSLLKKVNDILELLGSHKNDIDTLKKKLSDIEQDKIRKNHQEEFNKKYVPTVSLFLIYGIYYLMTNASTFAVFFVLVPFNLLWYKKIVMAKLGLADADESHSKNVAIGSFSIVLISFFVFTIYKIAAFKAVIIETNVGIKTWTKVSVDSLDFEQSKEYCDSLNGFLFSSFMGYSGWRLPTMKELRSLSESKDAISYTPACKQQNLTTDWAKDVYINENIKIGCYCVWSSNVDNNGYESKFLSFSKDNSREIEAPVDRTSNMSTLCVTDEYQ